MQLFVAALAASLAGLASGDNKVTHLISAFHLQDIVRDTPFEARPPSVVAFHSASDAGCKQRYGVLGFNAGGMPDRRGAFIGEYDVDKQYEFPFFRFTDEMDLPARLEVDACPAIVVIPRDWTGRENNTEDIRVWDGEGDWRVWANDQIEELNEQQPIVHDERFTNELLLQRDDGESRCHHRISITPARIPHYTDRGWDIFEMPDKLYERLVAYYKKWEHRRTEEPWTAEQTETNYHETKMSLVSLDHDHVERDSMANDHVRPMVAEWANLPESELALKSFYGIREYFRGNELRTHIDVINTHVLSAVLCIEQVGIDEDWMLEVIDHYGERTEVACTAKQVILYESASLPHGRPRAFNGDKFVNAFVHYQPKGWDFTEPTWGMATSPTNFKGHPARQPQVEREEEDFEVDTEFEDEVEMEDLAGPPEVEDNGRRKAIFTNRATSERDLWWQGPKGIILQAPLAPGASVEINSFVGHKFIWSRTDQADSQQGKAHESGAEALRGDRVGDTVEITNAVNQQYEITDAHDEL